MFYVYEWYIVDTGEIIYVGKGKGNRYKVRKNVISCSMNLLKGLNVTEES